MGLKTFLSATFNAGTLAATTLSEGINALSGVTNVLSDAVEDFQRASAYEREKENALERCRTDLYYAKQIKNLKQEMQREGIQDLGAVRAELDNLNAQNKATQTELDLSIFKL